MIIEHMDLTVRAYNVAKRMGCNTSDDIISKIDSGVIRIGAVVTKATVIEGMFVSSGLVVTKRVYQELVDAIAVSSVIEWETYNCEWCKAHGYHVCDNPGYC